MKQGKIKGINLEEKKTNKKGMCMNLEKNQILLGIQVVPHWLIVRVMLDSLHYHI